MKVLKPIGDYWQDRVHLKKLTVKELDELFERVFAIADKAIEKHNPCELHRNELGFVCCKRYPNTKKGSIWFTKNLCCGGCRYLKPEKGCTANKPVFCRLYLCSGVNKRLDKHFRKLIYFLSSYFKGCFYLSKENLFSKLKPEMIKR